MTYVVIKEEKIKKVGRKKILIHGFLMKPHMKTRKELIEVEEIVIENPSFKENVLKMQFNVAFRRMLKMVVSVEEDSSNGDVKLALSELERMKKILKEKYQKEVSMNEFLNMWKKVEFLESKLKNNLLERQIRQEILMQSMMARGMEVEEKGRGR